MQNKIRRSLRQQRAYGGKVCEHKQPLTPLVFLRYLRQKTDQKTHSQDYGIFDSGIQVETCQKAQGDDEDHADTQE